MSSETLSPALRALFETLPQVGVVELIQVRPARRAAMITVESAAITTADGLQGDFTDGGRTKERQVTLIQQEHLAAVASMLGRESLDAGPTRRNIVVRGINLRALMHARFRIGSAVLEGTGDCAPCSLMEENLGPGGYNAMRGHGGLCAKVIEDGEIRVGDEVRFVELSGK